jgi:hypothetical protein
MKLLIALVAATLIVYLSSINWRVSVKSVFFILVIEGALRKWIFPQASEMIYFLKDLVLFGVYINYYGFLPAQKKVNFKLDFIKIAIALASIWCIFQGLNPSLGSPLVGVFGIKAYIFYIPLIGVLPSLFFSVEDLKNFLQLHLLLVIPVCTIGIVQFFSPSSSFINAYAPGQVQDVATFGVSSFVRITGTFSYLSGYAVYLVVCFGLLVPLVFSQQSKKWQTINLLELSLVAVNSFMTGSRGVIFAAGLYLILYILVKGVTRPGSLLRLLQRISLIVTIVAIAASIWFRPAVESFLLRTTTNKDVSGRVTGSFTEPLDFVQYKGLDGYGTGATHPGAIALRRLLNLPPGETIPVYYESEMGRVLLELGPIGFILWYGVRLSLILALWQVFWKLKRPLLKELALAAFLIQAIQINGQMVFHHTFSLYYWFLSSFIWLLPHLEKMENWYQEQQLQQHVQAMHFHSSPHR